MKQVLLIVHLMSLALGAGATITTWILRKQMTTTPDAIGVLVALQARFAALGRMAIALLWLTGLAMLWLVYGFDIAALGPWFWAKLAVVVALTIIIARIWMLQKAIASGGDAAPLRPAIGRLAGTLAPLLTLVVALAVLTFE